MGMTAAPAPTDDGPWSAPTGASTTVHRASFTFLLTPAELTEARFVFTAHHDGTMSGQLGPGAAPQGAQSVDACLTVMPGAQTCQGVVSLSQGHSVHTWSTMTVSGAAVSLFNGGGASTWIAWDNTKVDRFDCSWPPMGGALGPIVFPLSSASCSLTNEPNGAEGTLFGEQSANNLGTIVHAVG